MQLLRTLSRQQSRTLVPVTRRGIVWYVAGSTGAPDAVTPTIDARTGAIVYRCSCPDFSEWKRSESMRHEGICKHGIIIRARRNTGMEVN